MSSQRGRRRSVANRPREEIPVYTPNDLPAPSTSRPPFPRSASQATSQSRSEAQSAAASRSHSPTAFSQRSLSVHPDFSTAPLEIESLAGISMNPDPYNTFGSDMLLDSTFGDNNFMGNNNSASTSIGYQDFSSPLAPTTRMRKKELFVDPMPSQGPTFAQSSSQVNGLRLGSDQLPLLDSGLVAEGSRTATKRKRSRSPSIEFSSIAKMEPLHLSTEMADVQFKQENDSETPSTPSQDRKGKGKTTDRKGKGKQREVIPEDSPIMIPDSPIEALKPIPTTTTLPAKPLSEPLSAYTCPICFSAPTNATLTPCGHICCGVCLFTAVKTVMQRAQNVGAPDGNEARCPVCRALIPDWDGKGGGVIGLKIRAIFSL